MADAGAPAAAAGAAAPPMRRSGTPDAAPRISIIVPLYDRRNAGWGSLRSALAQRFARARYEVIAVTARSLAIGARDPDIDALLARCDDVVRTGVDDTVTANEIQLYLAGYRRCTGDLVFFCEGHTVLQEDCCALIDEHFARHAGCDLAWAPRRNHAESALGTLVAMHNLHHEQRAAAGGMFSLGATSVIRRCAFDALGGLDPRYLRFSEMALYHRARQQGLAISRIAAPLATHYNDMSVSHWRELAFDAGRARFAYYDNMLAKGSAGDARIRHRVYVLARRWPIAAVLKSLSRRAGAALLAIAIGALRLDRRLAYRCYRLALGCTDLAGYCRARTDEARQRRRRLGSRKQDAAA
ncbi:MAG: glycosyltransferase, partial [Casimicrobiaceae bacterium]